MKLCNDLFCGKKTATRTLSDSEEWSVVGIDVDPMVKPDVVADARFLPLRPDLVPDFLWVSPHARAALSPILIGPERA